MHVKSATVTALLAEAGLDDAWIKERIRARHFLPMTSTASAKRLRWSFGDATRLEIYKRLLAAGQPLRVGGAIPFLPLGDGALLLLLVHDDGSFKGCVVDPDAAPAAIEDNPSAILTIAASIDDAAAVVAIVDKAARPNWEDAA